MSFFKRRKVEPDVPVDITKHEYALVEFAHAFAGIITSIKADPALMKYLQTKLVPKLVVPAMTGDQAGIVKALAEDPVLAPVLSKAVPIIMKALNG